MIPTAFDEENLVLDPPPFMDPDGCQSLSVCRTMSDDGVPLVVSCWKVTAEEIAEIQRTGRVWLMLVGKTMQPAMLCGFKPLYQKGEGT